MIRAYTFKLRPNVAQIALIEAALEVQRLAYNTALRERLDIFEQHSQHISFFTQKLGIAEVRANDAAVRDLPYMMTAGTYKRLDEAWAAFRKRWNARCKAGESIPPQDAGMPRFIRYGENATLTYDGSMGAAWDYLPPNPDAAPNERKNAAFRLLPFGVIRTVKDRPIPPEAYTGDKPKHYKYGGRDGYKVATVCEITKKPKGYYVSVIVEDPIVIPTLPVAAEGEVAPPLPPCVELTFGMTDGAFVETSTGKTYRFPDVNGVSGDRIMALEQKMQRQRDASREMGARVITELERAPGMDDGERDKAIRIARRALSKGYHRTQNQKRREEERVTNRRTHVHLTIIHQILSDLPEGTGLMRYTLPEIEPLVRHPAARPDAESTGFKHNGAEKKAERTKVLLGAGWSAFGQRLSHEAAEVGVIVERVTPPRNTTKKPRKKKVDAVPALA